MADVRGVPRWEWAVAVQVPLWFYRHEGCGCPVVRVLDWCAYSRIGRGPRLFCLSCPEVSSWRPFFWLWRRHPSYRQR